MGLSVDYNGVSVSFDESDVTDVLTEIDCYDSEVEVLGYDADGNEYEAIASMSCDELVEIYEDTILEHFVPSDEEDAVEETIQLNGRTYRLSEEDEPLLYVTYYFFHLQYLASLFFYLLLYLIYAFVSPFFVNV